MSLREKTEFPFFEFPIFGYCRRCLSPSTCTRFSSWGITTHRNVHKLWEQFPAFPTVFGLFFEGSLCSIRTQWIFANILIPAVIFFPILRVPCRYGIYCFCLVWNWEMQTKLQRKNLLTNENFCMEKHKKEILQKLASQGSNFFFSLGLFSSSKINGRPGYWNAEDAPQAQNRVSLLAWRLNQICALIKENQAYPGCLHTRYCYLWDLMEIQAAVKAETKKASVPWTCGNEVSNLW